MRSKADGMSEWLEAIEAVMPQHQMQGLTTKELAERVGLTEEGVRRVLRILLRDKRVQCVRELRPRIDGPYSMVPAWRLSGKKKFSGKRGAGH